MDRPITTLFMLMSVDGKISTGATDEERSAQVRRMKWMWIGIFQAFPD